MQRPANSFNIESKRFSKKNIDICSKNLVDLEKSTLLFVKDEVKIKYQFKKIIIDLKNLVEGLNIKNSNPPFFNVTMTLWRK